MVVSIIAEIFVVSLACSIYSKTKKSRGVNEFIIDNDTVSPKA